MPELRISSMHGYPDFEIPTAGFRLHTNCSALSIFLLSTYRCRGQNCHGSRDRGMKHGQLLYRREDQQSVCERCVGFRLWSAQFLAIRTAHEDEPTRT